MTFLSLFLLFYFYKVVNELFNQYRNLFENTARLPISLFTFLIFSIIVIGLILTHVWSYRSLLKSKELHQRLGKTRYILAVLLPITVSYLVFYSSLDYAINGWWFKSLLLVSTLALMVWLMTEDESRLYSYKAFLASIILLSSIYIFTGMLQSVSSYPFSIGWSEGNRIYDYSLLYGSDIYNYPSDLPIPALISTGRQALWGLPFLFPNVSIFIVRLWNVILFSVPYFLLGFFVFRRKDQKLLILITLSLFTFLFLNQGPIYAPLVLAAILVAITRWLPTWTGMILVAIASYYMRDSRFTWVFAPAMWAVLIAVLEVEPKYAQSEKQKWLRAVLMGTAGIIGILVPQTIDDTIINLFSGNLAEFGSTGVIENSTESFLSVSGISDLISRQPLLWDRLLPNPTYPPGILLGLFVSVVPLILLFFTIGKKVRFNFSIWQKLILYGELVAFFIVGLVISVKIGGGGDLHNMDMFLVSLIITAGLLWHPEGKNQIVHQGKHKLIFKVLLFLVVLLPGIQGVLLAQNINNPVAEDASEAVALIQEAVEKYDSDEILFIDQRQLLTFNMINNVRLVPEYEKKVLMEMAMAEDVTYFEPFINDMLSHRFSLIISEPQYIFFQGSAHEGGFGSENDLWVEWVSIPILCNYEPVVTDIEHKYQILIPRQKQLKDYERPYCEAFFDEWQNN
jgi:hypothetical protein